MSSIELALPDVAARPSLAHAVCDGHLVVEEVDPVLLADSLETPFVLVSAHQLLDNANFIGDAFRVQHLSSSLVYPRGLPLPRHYADLLRDDPIYLETSCAAEIVTFRSQGVFASALVACASGGPQTIAAALDSGVDAISLNTAEEAALVAAAAASRDVAARCMLRLDREFAGGWWARGLAGPHRLAREAITVRLDQVATHPGLRLVGLAVDLGPLVAETEAYLETARLLSRLSDEFASAHGTTLEFIELGGGMAGEQVTASGQDGEPLGSQVRHERTWGDYARAIHSALDDRPLGLRVAPGEGLLAGCSALFAHLTEAREADQADSTRRFALAGQDWLPPGRAARVCSAPTVIANRASERHDCAHWLCLPHIRSGGGGAQRHFLRRRLPATTQAGDLVAFLDWGLGGNPAAVGDDNVAMTLPALLVDGECHYSAEASWHRRPR
jgi:diaminopimelate decarboxylase